MADNYVMKVADFGLARDVYHDDVYVKQTGVRLLCQSLLHCYLYPEKWCAKILKYQPPFSKQKTS